LLDRSQQVVGGHVRFDVNGRQGLAPTRAQSPSSWSALRRLPRRPSQASRKRLRRGQGRRTHVRTKTVLDPGLLADLSGQAPVPLRSRSSRFARRFNVR
jgi:hypothetical protein